MNVEIMSVEELENLRIKIKNKLLIESGICLVISILVPILLDQIQLMFFFAVFSFVIIRLINGKQLNLFNKNYKEIFIKRSLEKVFEGLEYNYEIGLPEHVIADTGMMNMGDRYSSNDYIKGKYKGINVELADVHIEEEHTTTDSDGHTTTTWVTIFMGSWMIFDFNKSFKYNMQVCHKWFGNNTLRRNDGEKYKKVKMEDVLFNKSFRVYGQSEEEVFYILTPHLMERIKNISDSIKGRILLCFIDNKLHVGINSNKDSFEHSVFKKINETEELELVSKDIKVITNFVDELKLDNNLFRKEVE